MRSPAMLGDAQPCAANHTTPMIADKIDELYREELRTPFRTRASNIGGCLRLTALLLSGEEPEPMPGETIRVFEHGTDRGRRLEEMARRIWRDARTQVYVEIPLIGEETTTGTLDLWVPSEGILADFKTSSVYGFSNVDVEGVSEEYEFQLMAYASGLERTYKARPKRMFLIYESRDSDARKGVRAGQLKEVEVPYTEELEERYQARLEALHALKDKDPFSVPGLPKDHWKCRMKDGRPLYCAVGPVRGRCHE